MRSSGYTLTFEDDSSAVFRFGETLVNLLKTSEAPGLVEPATVATRDAGVRFQFSSAWTTSTRCATN